MCEQEIPDAGTMPDGDLKPTGWKYQASMHGSLPGATNQVAWDTCEHATWFFLSWHRMELYFFEKFLRKATGNANLTLPYWNFGTNRRLPESFRTEMAGGSANALWWRFRSDRANTGMLFPETAVTTDEAFKQPAFFSNVRSRGGLTFGGGAFQRQPFDQIQHHPAGNGAGGAGQLELRPHNTMHGAIGLPGTDPNRFRSMTAVAGAGLDPIFWPMHANIDRAWACWQMNHQTPPTEPKSEAWLKSVQFTFFDVQDAAPGFKKVVMSGQDIINTASITVEGNTQLGYTYGADVCKGFLPLPAPAPLPGATQSTASFTPLSTPLTATGEYEGILGGDPVTVSIPLATAMRQRIGEIIQAGAPVNLIYLTIDGVAADEPSGAAYEIYLNLPSGALAESSSENFVSYLPFFGIGDHHNHASEHQHATSEGSTFSYDLTDVIRRLIANNKWAGDKVSVTVSNSFALDTVHTIAPPAPVSARARFESITLTVQ
jgi:tyrosinase